jgi:hypothetical protein
MHTASEYRHKAGPTWRPIVTDHDIAESASVDTARAVDFSPLDPQLADDFWPRIKTLRDQRRVSMDVAVDAALPRWPIDVGLVGAHVLTAIHRFRGRRVGQSPQPSGCRSSTAERISAASGLLGGVALHGDRARGVWLSGQAR